MTERLNKGAETVPPPTASARAPAPEIALAAGQHPHPPPAHRAVGVGAVTARKLRERGIATVGEVAQREEAALVSMLGRAAGRHLHALAHNRDPRSVRVGRRRRSIGAQRALGRSRDRGMHSRPISWRSSTASRAG